MGFDYFETFNPIYVLLTLTISQQWHICQLDISNAFLNNDLFETIYIKQLLGFSNPRHPHHVYLLHKSLYGLWQSPYDWFKKLFMYLQFINFSSSKIDVSLFYCYTHCVLYFLLVYVNDILILSPTLLGTPLSSIIWNLFSSPFMILVLLVTS